MTNTVANEGDANVVLGLSQPVAVTFGARLNVGNDTTHSKSTNVFMKGFGGFGGRRLQDEYKWPNGLENIECNDSLHDCDNSISIF